MTDQKKPHDLGLLRKNADKRRAVLLALKAQPTWSDRKIADVVGVDNKTVAAVRRANGLP